MNKNILVIAALAMGAFSATAQDAAPAVTTAPAASQFSLTTSVGYESKYIFRSLQSAEDIVTPSVNVSYGDFYVGIWSAVPIHNAYYYNNEIDLYAGYSTNLTEMFKIDLGATRYFYDENNAIGDLNDEDNTVEFYVGVSADMFLSPSLYVYRDFSSEIYTVEAKFGHSIDLISNVSLDLGANVGWAQSDDQAIDVKFGSEGKDTYTFWGATADVTYSFTEKTNASIGVRYAGSTVDGIGNGDDTDFDKNGVWFGCSFSTSF